LAGAILAGGREGGLLLSDYACDLTLGTALPPAMEQNRTLAALSALRLRCDGGAMTLAKLKLICKEVGEPQCPAACTRLELQCQLLAEVPADIALHYTELRYLRLDRNQIQRIERLEGLAALEVLNLQENKIERVEGLDSLAFLGVLNLSGNRLTCIEGLSQLPHLHTLLLADNRLSSTEAIAHLKLCPVLAELDLSHNRLADVGVISVLEELPQLRTLTLLSNPLSNASDPRNKGPAILPHYRRTVISRCRTLTALDHQPIFRQERLYCMAWWEAQAGCSREEVAVSEEAATVLQADVLFPVFRMLTDVDDLLNCAQVNRWWHACIQPRLREAELQKARSMAAAALGEWELVRGDMGDMHQGDFESLRCQESLTPPAAVLQLLHALNLLWHVACCGQEPAALPGLPQLQSSTWRKQVWEAAQDMLRSQDFPAGLMAALPLLSFRAVTRLRALTGSADDLEVYIPSLDLGALARAGPAIARVSDWLMAAEAHLYSKLRLERAEAHMRGEPVQDEPGSPLDAAEPPDPERSLLAAALEGAGDAQVSSAARVGRGEPQVGAKALQPAMGDLGGTMAMPDNGSPGQGLARLGGEEAVASEALQDERADRSGANGGRPDADAGAPCAPPSPLPAEQGEPTHAPSCHEAEEEPSCHSRPEAGRTREAGGIARRERRPEGTTLEDSGGGLSALLRYNKDVAPAGPNSCTAGPAGGGADADEPRTTTPTPPPHSSNGVEDGSAKPHSGCDGDSAGGGVAQDLRHTGDPSSTAPQPAAACGSAPPPGSGSVSPAALREAAEPVTWDSLQPGLDCLSLEQFEAEMSRAICGLEAELRPAGPPGSPGNAAPPHHPATPFAPSQPPLCVPFPLRPADQEAAAGGRLAPERDTAGGGWPPVALPSPSQRPIQPASSNSATPSGSAEDPSSAASEATKRGAPGMLRGGGGLAPGNCVVAALSRSAGSGSQPLVAHLPSRSLPLPADDSNKDEYFAMHGGSGMEDGGNCIPYM